MDVRGTRENRAGLVGRRSASRLLKLICFINGKNYWIITAVMKILLVICLRPYWIKTKTKMMLVRITKIKAYFQWDTPEARTQRSQHVTDSSSCSEGAAFLFWTPASAPLWNRLLITRLLTLLLLLWDVYHSANMPVIEGCLCPSKLEPSCLVFKKLHISGRRQHRGGEKMFMQWWQTCRCVLHNQWLIGKLTRWFCFKDGKHGVYLQPNVI